MNQRQNFDNVEKLNEEWKLNSIDCDFDGAYEAYLHITLPEVVEELISPLDPSGPLLKVKTVEGGVYRARRAIVIIGNDAIDYLLLHVPARGDPSIRIWAGRPRTFFRDMGARTDVEDTDASGN